MAAGITPLCQSCYYWQPGDPIYPWYGFRPHMLTIKDDNNENWCRPARWTPEKGWVSPYDND